MSYISVSIIEGSDYEYVTGAHSELGEVSKGVVCDFASIEDITEHVINEYGCNVPVKVVAYRTWSFDGDELSLLQQAQGKADAIIKMAKESSTVSTHLYSGHVTRSSCYVTVPQQAKAYTVGEETVVDANNIISF